RRVGAHLLLVRLPAGVKRAALVFVLEGLFGVDGEQAQRALEAAHADGVAVDDRRAALDGELAELERDDLELLEQLRGLVAGVALPRLRRAAGGEEHHAE